MTTVTIVQHPRPGLETTAPAWNPRASATPGTTTCAQPDAKRKNQKPRPRPASPPARGTARGACTPPSSLRQDCEENRYEKNRKSRSIPAPHQGRP